MLLLLFLWQLLPLLTQFLPHMLGLHPSCAEASPVPVPDVASEPLVSLLSFQAAGMKMLFFLGLQNFKTRGGPLWRKRRM
jgi:hypothetical protein